MSEVWHLTDHSVSRLMRPGSESAHRNIHDVVCSVSSDAAAVFSSRLRFRAVTASRALKHDGKTNTRRFSRLLVELQDARCPQGFLFLSTSLLFAPSADSLSSRQHMLEMKSCERLLDDFLLWGQTLELLTRGSLKYSCVHYFSCQTL